MEAKEWWACSKPITRKQLMIHGWCCSIPLLGWVLLLYAMIFKPHTEGCMWKKSEV